MIERWRAYFSEVSARQWALIAAVLLIAASGGALLWSDVDETAVIVQHVEPPPPALKITGLSAAAARTPLRNPFTDAHERRGEISSAVTLAETKDKVPPPSALPVHEQGASVSPAAPPVPPPAPLILRGVVTGADGTRLAILAKGTESAALAIGETWQGNTLRALSDTSATLDSASGTITLTRE